MQSLHGFFTALNDLVWGVPMIVLILGTGLYLQVRLGFIPLFKIGFGFRMIWQSRRSRCAVKRPLYFGSCR